MESPKGGPLTTFIMMLPLIVVPTIAMLKPADSSGLVSSLLSAASDQSDSQTTENVDGTDAFSDPQDEFDAVFGGSTEFRENPPQAAAIAGTTNESEIDAGLIQEALGQSLTDSFPQDFGSSPPPRPAPSRSPSVAQVPQLDAATEQLVRQLHQAGATKTLWFSPDNQSVGFVAFFPAGPGLVTYRFEAIAASHSTAVQDVVRQYQNWRGAQQR